MVLELLQVCGGITRGDICIFANLLFQNATRKEEKMFPAEFTKIFSNNFLPTYWPVDYNEIKVTDLHCSVHLKYIRFDIFPTRCNFTQFIYFWKTALHVSGGIFTHHQEHITVFIVSGTC